MPNAPLRPVFDENGGRAWVEKLAVILSRCETKCDIAANLNACGFFFAFPEIRCINYKR